MATAARRGSHCDPHVNLANRELKCERVQNAITKLFLTDVAKHAIKFSTHLCLRLKIKITAMYTLEQTSVQ